MAHPHWGPPLESYTKLYSLDAAQQRATIASLQEAAATAATYEICELSEWATSSLSDQEISVLVEKITLPKLESISQLLVDPDAFQHLVSPSLISGLIRLMGAVRVSGKPSPFSFEYGYLCFRLLTVALGACLLEQSGDLRFTISEMNSNTEIAPLLDWSVHVAQMVQDEIHAGEGTDRWDNNLGWTASATRAGRVLIISIQDAKTLLTLLWEDRTTFVEAFMRTYSPGLSPVMFVFWRYICYERSYGPNSNPESLVAPFFDLHWRYLLVATSDQDAAIELIDLQNADESKKWDNSPKYATVEDTRAILHAFCSRLSPANPSIYLPMCVSTIVFALRLAVQHLVPGAEDLLPRFIGLVIGGLWSGLPTPEPNVFLTCAGHTFLQFGNIFHYLEHARVSNLVLIGIVEEMVNNEFLDLIAHTLLAYMHHSTHKPDDLRENFRSSTIRMFDKLAKLIPRRVLESHFRGYVRDWLRFQEQLSILPSYLASLPSCGPGCGRSHFVHDDECVEVWAKIGRALGQQENINRIIVAEHQY